MSIRAVMSSGCVKRPDESNPDEGNPDEGANDEVRSRVGVSWLGSGATWIGVQGNYNGGWRRRQTGKVVISVGRDASVAVGGDVRRGDVVVAVGGDAVIPCGCGSCWRP
ncbi:hypothetical protein L1987_58730 [Smallanthus sonchifolius]|uniref:Uncharacterized protein n=1 Tax=Smallanthus sonchifolius TaxID=185202 RepID=A0ACB9D3T8_9ASTR|nr:hypothetical protein L1987_58730 [Smallanthus sonchifolius]